MNRRKPGLVTRLKEQGRFLPSYGSQKDPEPKKQWISHSGKKQRIKNLREACKDVLNSEDPEIIEVIQKARDTIGNGPFSEYGALMVIFQAKDISDSTGIDFVEALNYILDKLKTQGEQNESAKGNSKD